MTLSDVLVVGESPGPRGAPPGVRALGHLPRNGAGDRLRKILGLDDRAYARVPRVNLCRRRWDDAAARRAASRLRAADGCPLVLLGARVARAFGFPYAPFTFVAPNVLVLPHPSGRCRAWNDPAAAPLARRRVRALLSYQDAATRAVLFYERGLALRDRKRAIL